MCISPTSVFIQSRQIAICLHFGLRMPLHKEAGNLKTIRLSASQLYNGTQWFKMVTSHIEINSSYGKAKMGTVCTVSMHTEITSEL